MATRIFHPHPAGPGGLQLREAPFRGLPAGIATATFQCLQHAEQQRQNLGLDAATRWVKELFVKGCLG